MTRIISVAQSTHIGENFLAEGSSMEVRTSRRRTETAPTVTADAHDSSSEATSRSADQELLLQLCFRSSFNQDGSPRMRTAGDSMLCCRCSSIVMFSHVCWLAAMPLPPTCRHYCILQHTIAYQCLYNDAFDVQCRSVQKQHILWTLDLLPPRWRNRQGVALWDSPPAAASALCQRLCSGSGAPQA